MSLKVRAETPHVPISILLLRNIPEYVSKSMERFADEMARGLQLRPDVEFHETTIHVSRFHAHSLTRQLERQSAMLIRYPAHVRRQRADLYHIADHAYAPLVASIPAGRAVVTCHDLMLLHAQIEDIGFRGRRITVERFRWATSFLRRAAVVACVSQATADDVSDLLRVESSRIRVIPNGISAVFAPMSAEVRAERRRAIDPSGQRPIILHVSTGTKYKNIRGTLEVVEALASQGLDPIFIRVGKPLGPEDSTLASRLGVLQRLREFVGVPDDELARLYGVADVLLFPSRWEGFGWPPLEALACGTPSVIASECRAVVEIVGDAALAESADDVYALAAAVRRIVTTPRLREELVERGRQIVAALTWERTVAAYMRAYEEVLTQGQMLSAPE